MRSRPQFGSVVLAASLALAACSGGGEAAPTTTTTTSTTRPTTTTTAPPLPTSTLTGLEVQDEIRERPVVAVKFDNVDGKATPQVGIGAADVIYEIPVEGTVTRLLALFQSTDAAPIGPVRSARGSEVGLLEELNRPLFTWHGANRILARAVRSAEIVPRSIDDIPQLFYRQAGRPAPYNSFARGTAQIRETAPEGATGPEEDLFTFADEDDDAPSAEATPATVLRLVFPQPFGRGGRRSSVPIRFEWDEGQEKWLRFQADAPHVDGDGNQLGMENVIIRFTGAVDSGTRDTAGSVVPTAVVVGEGAAWIFSRGTVTMGSWSKPDNASRTQYLDAAGDDVLLTPGRTWIAMPYGLGSTFE